MRPELRSTRRGWMMFRAADMGAMGGGKSSSDSSSSPLQTALTQLQAAITTHEGHMSGSIPTQDASGKPDPSQTTMMDQMKAALAALQSLATSATASGSGVDYKALLLQLLDLDPATADDAAIKTAFDAEEAEPEDDTNIDELKTKAATAETLQQQLDALQLQYDELNKKQTDLYRQKQEADADEILKVYEGHFVDDASKAAIRNILLSDKEAGIAILNGLKKPDNTAAPAEQTDTAATAAKKDATPPAPKHDPAAAASAGPSEEEIAQKTRARAAELQKEFPKKSNAELFAQAEKEVRAKLSAAKAA